MCVPTCWWETMPGRAARTPSVFLETACHSSLAQVCSEQQDVSRLFERSAGFEASVRAFHHAQASPWKEASMSTDLKAVAFGLVASCSWGAADFSGGVATRRAPVGSVVVATQAIGLVLFIVLAAALPQPFPSLPDLVWDGAAGVADTVGLLAFYRALAVGRMGDRGPHYRGPDSRHAHPLRRLLRRIAPSTPTGWLRAGSAGSLVALPLRGNQRAPCWTRTGSAGRTELWRLSHPDRPGSSHHHFLALGSRQDRLFSLPSHEYLA